MKTLTLEQLIEAAEICGSGKEGACQVCPAHNDGEVVSSACIESVHRERYGTSLRRT